MSLGQISLRFAVLLLSPLIYLGVGLVSIKTNLVGFVLNALTGRKSQANRARQRRSLTRSA
jgi:hypothetical protein